MKKVLFEMNDDEYKKFKAYCMLMGVPIGKTIESMVKDFNHKYEIEKFGKPQ
jgi:hypothetical protein